MWKGFIFSAARHAKGLCFFWLFQMRKAIASFDVFQAFPACPSYKSGNEMEKSVEPQNERSECTRKLMWKVIWNKIL